jgi:hypothetical protein
VTVQRSDHLVDHELEETRLARRRDPGNVGAEEHVGHGPERRRRGQGLGLDDIEAGDDVAPAETPDEGVGVEGAAP